VDATGPVDPREHQLSRQRGPYTDVMRESEDRSAEIAADSDRPAGTSSTRDGVVVTFHAFRFGLLHRNVLRYRSCDETVGRPVR